mmetsp:Transcript_9247/g.19790  ORF Transcript_9247/g.19790 Transcript_9247/m.19790 type:complete len:156 (-) Transcript_9247:539-1006(-)
MWRYSDILDSKDTAMDADGNVTSSETLPIANILHGLPDNTNSDEAIHLWFKARLDNLRLTIPEQMANMFRQMENYTRDEVASAGVSSMQVPYGSIRVKTSKFAWDRDTGMIFLGYPSMELAKVYDVAALRQYGRVKRTGRGLDTKVYMLRGIDDS